MKTKRCILCESDFRPEALKDGKCSICQQEHPECESRQEMLSKIKQTPNKMGDDSITEERVIELINSALNPMVEKLEELLGAKEEKRGPGRPKKTE
jgi:hypothetical protein